MDMSSFHIAQQSRRDKLRIQPDLGVYSNQDYSRGNGNICYDPTQFCSEMINFSANPLFKDGLTGHHQEPDKRSPFHREIASTTSFNPADSHYFNTWRSSDWVSNNTSVFMGDGGASSSSKIMNSTNPIPQLLDNNFKPNYLGYHQDQLHSPMSNADMNGSSSMYQDTLQELVTSSNARTFGLEFPSLKQKSEFGGNELLLLPAYADQMRLDNQWSNEDELDRDMVMTDHSNRQALSLSLSSVPSPKVHEFHISEKDFQTRDVCGSSGNVQDSRNWINASPNLSAGTTRILGGAQLLTPHRNPGPLGPFTGYAIILRSSRFLRPAQQLLEDLCCIARPKNVDICNASDEMLDDVRVSNEALSSVERAGKGVMSNSRFVLDDSNNECRDPGDSSCSSPQKLDRKAKLLFMQEEVCKRYKQYHQQMQMVVSSFETVAGLSTATPFVSLALRMILKHFRSLKNAITDQIKSIKNSLGEELPCPSGGTKGDANGSILKFFDQNFQKQKGSSNSIGVLEGQHIWRPQRGLPERAVSILRAWLFDHFLHPYPTDTDKHMLATQTGLTRNQVSNWFINARVRVWKPMVEEIHMLETKGSSGNGGRSNTTNGKTTVEGCDKGDFDSQSPTRLRMRAVPDKQAECSVIGSSEQVVDRSHAGLYNQEKRSRIEYQDVPDGSLMEMLQSHHHRGTGIEMGGMGSVSLTLGLSQSAENAQQQRHLRHYGGQIIRGDFVG